MFAPVMALVAASNPGAILLAGAMTTCIVAGMASYALVQPYGKKDREKKR
jgi:hypothetical protein